MEKNALYIQSGGPTAVINASALGVIRAARDQGISKLYAAVYGFLGLLNGCLFDTSALSGKELNLLKNTPSSLFGSCRHRLDSTALGDFEKILIILKQYNIRYLFINGGNGTLKACFNIIQYLRSVSYECQVVVIPKTVDNDIPLIDHSPGFPSAARHAITSISELACDFQVYQTNLIMVVEVMGRNSGWLAASTIACRFSGYAPDLIYIPENPFSVAAFINDVQKVYQQKGKCLAVVAEGVKDEKGRYLFEYGNDNKNPHLDMGGITPYLSKTLKEYFNCKVRGIDLGLMQRCSAHLIAQLDSEEAYQLGYQSVVKAVEGATDVMLGIVRPSEGPYRPEIRLFNIHDLTRFDACLPSVYISEEKNYIHNSYLNYILPLIGELPKYTFFNKETCYVSL